jgi:hypothetical protein
MKRLISLLFAIVCVFTVSAICAFAEGGVFIADSAGFFTDSELDRLYNNANDIIDKNGWCIMIITEDGYYSQSDARSELKQWYADEFGSSQKGAALIMTSETGSGSGNNDYAIIIETFGGASINKTTTYNRVEDYFLDYDEYGSADAFLSACGGNTSGSSDGKTSPLVIGIVIVLVIGAVVISIVKRVVLGRLGIYSGSSGGSYNRRSNYRSSSRSNGGGSRGGRRSGRR